MNSLLVASLFCMGALVAANSDGQWKGEGLLESQDHYANTGAAYYGAAPAYSGAYSAYAQNEGQWKGEGLLESQDAYGKSAAYYGAGVVPAYYGASAYSSNDGQWKGEGLAESQDLYGKTYGAGINQYAGVYAHGAAPIGADGRVVDTADVAHAKASFFAAYNNAAQVNHAGAAYVPTAYSAGAAYAPAVYSSGAAYAPAAYGVYGAGAQLAHGGQFLQDTPEVAHAKAQHFAAKAATAHGPAHY